MLYVKMVRTGFMASEETSFENVDGRTTDASGYTISSPMSLQLRWAKNKKKKLLYLLNVNQGYLSSLWSYIYVKDQ